jgi:hypothetical protein
MASVSAAGDGAGDPRRITLQLWHAIVGPSSAKIARSAWLSGTGAEPVVSPTVSGVGGCLCP